MQRLPLFPLGTILFPGGRLPLQIFEPRYTRMVVEVMKADAPFGVIHIEEGHEVERAAAGPPRLAKVGSFAMVVDFDRLPNGLLGITVEGRGRFRLIRRKVEKDGLNVGTVEPLVDPGPGPVPEHLEPLAALARGWMQDPIWSTLGITLDPTDATSLSGRLAELLPFDVADKQRLLEMDDPIARLEWIVERLEPLDGGSH